MFEIRCPLHEASLVGRNQVALIFPEGRFTFYEYDQVVSSTATRLRAAGISMGERLGISVPQGWRGIVLFFATLRAGAVACFGGKTRTAAEWSDRWARIACDKVLVDEDFSKSAGGYVRMPSTLLKSSEVVTLALGDSEAGLVLSFRGEAPATITFEGVGMDRAILHSHGSHYYGALSSNISLNLRTNDRWLIADALASIDAIAAAYRCAVSGATLVVPHPGHSPADSILEQGITHAALSVEDLQDLVGRNNTERCRLKTAVVKQTVSGLLRREAQQMGICVQTCYMIAEMTSNVTCIALNTPPEKQHTRGRALRYCDVRVNKAGRIQVRGRGMCDGYVEGTRVMPSVDHEGWFTTNDHGFMDEEGYLTVWEDPGSGENVSR